MSSLLTTAFPIGNDNDNTNSIQKAIKNRGSGSSDANTSGAVGNLRAMTALVNGNGSPPVNEKNSAPEPNSSNFLAENAGDSLGDFSPPPYPSSGCNPSKLTSPPSDLKVGNFPATKKNDAPVTQEGFRNLPKGYNQLRNNTEGGLRLRAADLGEEFQMLNASDFSKNGSSSSFSNSNNSDMLTKLNQIIHILEEQRDIRTKNVTEELVLYCFLGVFTIFVVDSFSKAGKYVR